MESAEPPAESSNRLEQGPAFGKTLPKAKKASERDWPTFRGDVQRSGATSTMVRPGAKLLWRTAISTQRSPPTKHAGIDREQAARQRITPPVIAGGQLLIAETDAHRVVALDAITGKQQWAFTAGGRIDSPPTVHQEHCLFGSHDGWVYCLRTDNGQLVWRLRAAPLDKRIVAFGQLESPCPVFGSVLVFNGVAYATAGRSSAAQGGVIALAIVPHTGEVIWKQNVPVGLNDLLVSDGRALYLRNLRLDTKTGKTFQAARLTGFKGPGEVRIPADPERGPARPHYLYCGWFSTLLDGSWRFAKTTYAKGNQRRTYDGHTFGQVISFDKQRTYAFQTGYWSGDHLYGGPRYPTQLVATANVLATSSEADSTSQPLWTIKLKRDQWIEAMTLTHDVLFVAGPEDRHKRREKGGFLWALSTQSGKKLSQQTLPSVPCLEGLAAANSRLFVSTQDGEVVCYGDE